MSILSDLPLEFCKRFAVWARIEPRCRSEEHVRQGLEARIADPLWMLARQWQMGEFQAEDSGSPVQAKYEIAQSTHVTLNGSADAIELNNTSSDTPAGLPLETVVEREPIVPNLHDRVRIGQQFERFLRRALGSTAEQVIHIYRTSDEHFRLQSPDSDRLKLLDPATRRFLNLMQDRAIDGVKALECRQTGQIPELPPTVQADLEDLEKAFQDLENWYAALYSLPQAQHGSAWKEAELEYNFELMAGPYSQEVVLSAPDYRSGDLEWYTMDLKQLPSETTGWTQYTEHVNPTRIDYAGKPNERWWAFEDHNVDLAKLNPATTDLAKLLLTEFALVYADDWYIFPVEAPVGGIIKIKQLLVTDTFGKETRIRPAIDPGATGSERWEMFTHAMHNQPDETHRDYLWIPPTPGDREESPPLEEVRFMRDEGANMVFAVEKTVTNGLGYPVEAFELHQARRNQHLKRTAEGAAKESTETDLRYRFATAVPINWFPYVPVKVPENAGLPNTTEHSIRLRWAIMPRVEDGYEPSPMSRLLINPDTQQARLDWLNEESMPRAGIKVQKTAQRIRWLDGKTYVWYGKKVAAGKSEGQSGLIFDKVFNK